MSRVGRKPIEIPAGVTVTVNGSVLIAKGPLGEQQMTLPESITCQREGNTLTFHRSSDDKKIRALHGMVRALAANMITGVSRGFEKQLELQGVGYKAELRGKNLVLSLGFSHPVVFIPPEGIQITVSSPTQVSVKGSDRQLVGEVAAVIRKIRPPEPYKGKGIRYVGEFVRRKAGKAAGK
ncbi:50S ribosomal protein L6 [bacterium HR20]|uniref:Large ribosomal subunit protein uL6 n=1 Tax=uncultured Bacteroidota bacterium TaxID=152509 RepID=H5SFZ5_9BACT|nr:50S ribosomal protein L6 [uncultured Bacteroidetes bacterium]GBD04935.1 50S ribosomal protein L6 [bacterium HR20]